MDLPRPRPFEVDLLFKIGTYDIDFAGIVSNIVYIRWLEDLRLKVLEEHWPLEDQIAAGQTPVLLSTDISYLRALRLFERPVGTMWMSSLGKARFTLEAEITVEGVLAARATQVGALVGLKTLRPMRIPRELAMVYSKYV